MAKIDMINECIDKMENDGYGVMFVDTKSEKMVPYEMFTEDMMEQIVALYFVEMTDEIFEDGLESLDGVEYIKIEVEC